MYTKTTRLFDINEEAMCKPVVKPRPKIHLNY